jgi:hypothetical protein
MFLSIANVDWVFQGAQSLEDALLVPAGDGLVVGRV